MKSKKIIAAISAAVLAFGMTANAASMTLEQATTYALENSPSYKSSVADAHAKEYSAKSADFMYRKYTQNKYKESQYPVSSFDMYTIKMGYVLNATELQMRAAQRALEKAEYNLKTQVKSSFYTYLSKQEKVKIAEDSLKTAEERLVEATEKKKQGTLSELELKNFEVAVITARNSVNEAKRNANLALENLKTTLGYKETDVLEVSGAFERNTEKVLSPDEVIAKLDTNTDVMTLNESLKLAAERFLYAERWYFTSEHEYWNEKYTYEKAQHDYDVNMNSMRNGIRELYNGLLSADEGITSLEANIDLVTKMVEAYKLQYELGMVTANDYIEQEQKLVSLKNQLVDVQLSEMSLKLQYKSFYTQEQ